MCPSLRSETGNENYYGSGGLFPCQNYYTSWLCLKSNVHLHSHSSLNYIHIYINSNCVYYLFFAFRKKNVHKDQYILKEYTGLISYNIIKYNIKLYMENKYMCVYVYLLNTFESCAIRNSKKNVKNYQSLKYHTSLDQFYVHEGEQGIMAIAYLGDDNWHSND